MRIHADKTVDIHAAMTAESREEQLNELIQSKEGLKQSLKEQAADFKSSFQELSKELPVEEERLARELVFYAEKADITEETVRLQSHLVQYEQLLDSDDDPGRNLDFLGQEMNREANTLSAKTADMDIAGYALSLKTELNRIREQIMNIE